MLKHALAVVLVVALVAGSQATGIQSAVEEWVQVNPAGAADDVANFVETVEDVKAESLQNMVNNIENNAEAESQELVPASAMTPVVRFEEAREMATTEAQTGAGVSLRARTKARAKEKWIGLAADALNMGGNFIMDKMGVDPDSTGRKIFDAVTDPVGTAVGMGMDALGVPEDSALRTAADAATWLVCFAGETPVTMADGSVKAIAEVKIGDLTTGGRVTGTMKFAAPAVLFDYMGVIVAGSHKVLENGEFVAVKDSLAAVVADRTEAFVYDIDTTGHRIEANGVVFADFSEVEALPDVELLETNALNQA